MKIKELILKLSKYDQDTEVCGGYIDGESKGHYELVIAETHPIGDRDTEEELMILLGYEKHETEVILKSKAEFEKEAQELINLIVDLNNLKK